MFNIKGLFDPVAERAKALEATVETVVAKVEAEAKVIVEKAEAELKTLEEEGQKVLEEVKGDQEPDA